MTKTQQQLLAEAIGDQTMYQSLASTLHLLLCKQNHRNENGCDWYIEDQAVGHWEKTEHQKWLNKAEGIVLASGQSPQEVESLLRELIGIISNLSFIKNKNEGLAEIIDTIIIEATKV